jgi:hypothetical protein
MGRLIAGGDSFVYGSELADCHINDIEVVSHLTYPALIAKELKMDYCCAAKPGYSNNAIRRTVIDACENSHNIDLVIVMWSFPNRYEFKFGDKWEQISAWSTVNSIEEIKKEFVIDNPIVLQHHADKLQRDQKLGVTEFAQTFYNHVGSNKHWETYSFLSDVLMLQQYLKLKKIPYLFTAVDETLIESSHYIDGSLATLRSLIDMDSWTWFNGKGFYTWAKHQGFPFATTHPREEAHIEAAHLVYEHLRYISRLP